MKSSLVKLNLQIFCLPTMIVFSGVILALIAAGYATELLPERYLKPQNFNHHPFTDVGVPASVKKASKIISPYAILSKKRPREGREFPPQNIIYYPTPHPSTVSRKQIDTNEIDHYEDPYVNIPKNYAFSYIVKDQHSGDDFSHSQAHNGKATRGQYRVKLPDGRTQIVSYTADHKGYRADVQYEEEIISKPFNKPLFKPFQNIPQTPAKLPQILPQSYQNYDTAYTIKHIPVVDSKISAEVAYTAAPSYKSDSSNYIPDQSTPVTYVAENVPIKFLASAQPKPTVAPHYPPEYSQKFVSTTPTPYLRQEYVSSTVAQRYIPQHFIASTPLYPIQQVATTAATPTYDQSQYVNYHQISSTTSPQQAVIVTPKPIYNSAIEYSHL